MAKRRSKRLNLKVALLLPIVLAILAGAVYGLHEYQVGRTARKMLNRAKQAEADGKLDDAIHYYEYYLRYDPKQDEVFTTLALLLATQAEKTTNRRTVANAYQRLEAAAIRAPDNLDVIRRLADLSLRTGQYQTATEHLRRLIKQFPKEAALVVKLGRCQIASEHYRDATASFQAAIAQDPSQIEAYVILASLLREKLDDRDGADAIMNQMVMANPASPQAYIERARYWKVAAKSQEAEADLATALEKGPNDRQVLLTAAQFALDARDADKAKEYLQKADRLFPNDTELQLAMAELYRVQNDTTNYRKYQEQALAKSNDPLALAQMAEAQLATKDLEAVRATMARMKQAGYSPEFRDYIEARILIVEGKFREAATLLERLRPRFASASQMALQIDLQLGACYEQLRLPAQQLEAFQRALTAEPSSRVARIGYASALLRTGKAMQALAEYRKLEQAMGTEEFLKVPGLRNALFQLLLIRNAQLPKDKRNWEEAETLLAKADQAGHLTPAERTLRQAELAAHKGQLQQAKELLTAAQKENPKELSLWTTLANVTTAAEGPQAALAVLDAAGKAAGNSMLLELMRVNLAVRLGGQKGKPVLAAVESRAVQLPEAERPVVWQALGASYYRLLDRTKTKEMWTKLAAARPTDVSVRLTLFDLAREANDETGMGEAAEAIKKLLGPRSAESYYCEISRLVWQVQHQKAKVAVLEGARKQLTTALELRPTWHELPRLEAEIAMLENRLDDAIVSFQRANELGKLSPVYLGQLARLLFSRGRYSEAKLVLDQLSPEETSPTLEKIEAEVVQRLGQTEEALKLAAESVADSTKAVDFLWYGQLLARADKSDEAVKAFRRALELDPKLPEAYLALVGLLVKTNHASDAEKLLSQAQSNLPDDRKPLVLAECYRLLGQTNRAEQSYQSALAKEPDNLALLRLIAEFYVRTGRTDAAKKSLEQLMKVAQRDPQANEETLFWGRRLLAQVLAQSGEYAQLQQALALLKENTTQGKLAPQDLRIQALILARSNDRQARLQAVSLLEAAQSSETPLTAEERFILAQLYDKENRWHECRELMLELLTEHPKETLYLVQYIQMLTAHDASAGELELWVKRLEENDPESAVTKVTKARLLAKAGKSDEATRLLESLIPRPTPLDKVAYLRDVALLLEEIKQEEPARKLLVEFAEKHPGGSLALAAFLGRHGRAQEALDQCEIALKEMPLATVLPTAVNVLRSQGDKARPEDFRRVETWFERALKDKTDSKAVQLQLASLRDLQDRYDELIQIYRDFLKREDVSDRERAVVWNNLAYVLAGSGTKLPEAKQLIDQAIGIAGPTPEMLDTRGLVALASGKPQEAAADFRQSLADRPSGLKQFHLALALLASGDRTAAQNALKAAHDTHRLVLDEVPKLERDKYRKLVESLKEEGGKTKSK